MLGCPFARDNSHLRPGILSFIAAGRSVRSSRRTPRAVDTFTTLPNAAALLLKSTSSSQP